MVSEQKNYCATEIEDSKMFFALNHHQHNELTLVNIRILCKIEKLIQEKKAAENARLPR